MSPVQARPAARASMRALKPQSSISFSRPDSSMRLMEEIFSAGSSEECFLPVRDDDTKCPHLPQPFERLRAAPSEAIIRIPAASRFMGPSTKLLR